MCGIWALFGCEDCGEYLSSCLEIKHRGPDAFRIESVSHMPSCCLGFHRLAIIDDLYGMQPMQVHSMPNVWMIYNGEIYNYKLLQKEFGFAYESDCDGEAILRLYEKFGADEMTKHLDGVFAYVLVDKSDRKVYIGRDTYGVRPAFKLYSDDSFLAISSEVKGLIGIQSVNGFRKSKVEHVLPGHYETYDLTKEGKCVFKSITQFHSVGQVPKYKTLVSPQEGDMYENIRKIFKAAVKKRMVAQRRIGCLLSGGLDSSLVTSLVVNFAKEEGLEYPVQTFSIGLVGSPDLAAAKEVADFLGTEHHEVLFTEEDAINAFPSVIKSIESYDITTIRASTCMYLLSEYIRDKTDSVVIFSGEGADELLQGYIYFHKAPTSEEADEESRRLLKDLYLTDNLRADRTTAAFGLELRVPFLDHQFISYILGLPNKERQPQNGIEKYIMRKAFDGQELIPEKILWRSKEAFSDGVASKTKSLFVILQEYAEKKVTETQIEESANRFPNNTPRTKEAYLYREIFEKSFPDHWELTPYYWMPKWTDATDPSARQLSHYKDS